MYVKWVIRRHKNEDLAKITFYDAYLVQSYKNGAGEPRQRTIAYLGNLRLINGSFPVIERALFYTRMEEYLRHEVPPELFTEEERIKLYTGLAEVAPAPTEEEIQQGSEIHAVWHANYFQAHSLSPSSPGAPFSFFEEDQEEHEVSQFDLPVDRGTMLGKLGSKLDMPNK
ncbi:MAG: hypothetical protein HXX08_02195 [Chloroflexi bacterium]|jgi:hypothetical protein|uniref:Uncharacterized protein n=1 Tax=Candidatus Chlorohelix allophototropha TaxID=3003348 RepID=A0A8T7LUX8_9CHLR|nr:hypothetical protein [Chloroflexota bacterium]WJW66556.1 hypothetical protein OZ401_002359 [Chloroflexota bacterium L227-S17]